MSDPRALLTKKLRTVAQRSTSGALELGAGIVGQIPFYMTIIGLSVVFITNVLLAFQQSARANQSQQEAYFIATIVGLGIFVFGLLLSLNALSDIIGYVRTAAEIGDPNFVWRTGEEESLFQVQSLPGARANVRDAVAEARNLFRPTAPSRPTAAAGPQFSYFKDTRKTPPAMNPFTNPTGMTTNPFVTGPQGP
jgi:hypothetical protein